MALIVFHTALFIYVGSNLSSKISRVKTFTWSVGTRFVLMRTCVCLLPPECALWPLWAERSDWLCPTAEGCHHHLQRPKHARWFHSTLRRTGRHPTPSWHTHTHTFMFCTVERGQTRTWIRVGGAICPDWQRMTRGKRETLPSHQMKPGLSVFQDQQGATT